MQLLSQLMAQKIREAQEQNSQVKCVNKALESCGILLPRVKKLQLPKLLKQLKVRHFDIPTPASRVKVLE